MIGIQKKAWTRLVFLLISGFAVFIMYLAGFQSAVLILTFGLCGTAGHLFSSTIKNDPGSVPFDERDHTIELKANRICFGFSFAFFVTVCLSFWVYYRLQGIETISIDVLTFLIWPPFIAQILSHDVILLVLYRNDNILSQGEMS